MITRGQLKCSVYEKLNKSATTKGFYTDSKVNLAIQECLDFIAAHMFLADDGWQHKIQYFDTVANQVTVPLPPHMTMILEVRYMNGNVYYPLAYDQDFENAQWAGSSGAVQLPWKYRLVDNALYFNPPLAVGGTAYLQIEYAAYPRKLLKDSDFVESQFDRSMFHYCVYRACSVLAGNVGQFSKAWKEEEAQWFKAMQDIIYMRNAQATPIKDWGV